MLCRVIMLIARETLSQSQYHVQRIKCGRPLFVDSTYSYAFVNLDLGNFISFEFIVCIMYCIYIYVCDISSIQSPFPAAAPLMTQLQLSHHINDTEPSDQSLDAPTSHPP